jgi:hypothetical protein
MEPLDETIVRSFLRADAKGKVQKEDDKLEYKEVFDNSSKEAKAKYAKEMAALHNYQGGYLIFGVNDAQELVGLHSFIEPDNAKLVDDINTYFSPAIRFQSKSFAIDDKIVFVIYVEKRVSIPTACIRDHDKILSDGTIYWRYSAKSAPIKSGDLIHLLQSLRGEETAKLTEIAAKEFRSKFKPKLWYNGGSKDGGEVKFRIENDGETATVTGFEVLESNSKQLFPPHWKNYRIVKGSAVQPIVKSGDTQWRELVFKVAMNYDDDEGHKYQGVLSFENGKASFAINEL